MHSQRYISLLCMDSHKTQSPISLEICGLNGNVSERIEITGYHLHMYETKQNEKNIFFSSGMLNIEYREMVSSKVIYYAERCQSDFSLWLRKAIITVAIEWKLFRICTISFFLPEPSKRKYASFFFDCNSISMAKRALRLHFDAQFSSMFASVKCEQQKG